MKPEEPPALGTGRRALGSRLPRRGWALLLVIVGLAAGLTTAAVSVPQPLPSMWTVALLAAAILAGDAVRVDLPQRRAGVVRFTLGDAALTGGLLLAAPTEVVAASAIAVSGVLLLERVPVEKFLFNLVQYVAGAAAAALTVAVAAPRPGPVDARSFVVVLAAVALFLVVNTVSVSGMISATRRSSPLLAPWLATWRRIMPTAALLSVSNAGIGLLAVLLGLGHPWALPALAIPLGLLYAASRERVGTALDRERFAAFVGVEQRLGESTTYSDVSETLVDGVEDMLGCHAAVWSDGAWVTAVPAGTLACPVDPNLTVPLVARGPALGPAQAERAAAIGIGGGVLVVWPGDLGITKDTEEWLQRVGQSGRVHFDRVGAHLALERERATLRTVVHGTADGIYAIDARGIVLLWNPAMSKLSQVAPADALQRPVETLLGDGPWTKRGTHEVTRDGGEERVWRVSVTGVREGSGQELRVAVVHDISEERRVARMKDDMLAVVSHELRTPLTPIKGSAQLLRTRWERLSAEHRVELLEQIEGRADHMTRLVEDLLLVAQLSDRSQVRPRVTPVPADLAVLLRANLMLHQAGNPTHEIVLDLPDSLPADTDPLRLRQIIDNLVENACKYSEAGSRVEVRAYADGQGMVIEVADEGRGIGREDLARIFERFERVEDPLHMTTSGTGLGLYIVRALVEALGGTITIDSELGRGTTVMLRLPRTQWASQPSPQPVT